MVPEEQPVLYRTNVANHCQLHLLEIVHQGTLMHFFYTFSSNSSQLLNGPEMGVKAWFASRGRGQVLLRGDNTDALAHFLLARCGLMPTKASRQSLSERTRCASESRALFTTDMRLKSVFVCN